MPALTVPRRLKSAYRAAAQAAALALVVALFSGCDEGTPDRIKEKSAVFYALTDAQKRRVIDGVFEVGDNADQVYMAIGTPVRVKSKVIPEGTIEMWTYINYFSSHGASKLALTTPSTGQFKASEKDPGVLTQSLAVPETESNTLYVFFLNGRVAQIKLDTQGRK
ncbi:MAG: hypothetical protein JWM35_2118 [Verrucomicrobia bacterium]|nr:hypothetical protein [Verrucomicrobiota bacterium]